METKQHWETVYETKQPSEVSWTQEIPQTSLDYIESFNLPKDAAIIDIGGGDSNLVDYLLELGYTNITVLDISSTALERAKTRLKNKAMLVKWIVCDITNFEPTEKYDVWHDRATFHFLISDEQIRIYKNLVNNAAYKYLVIGTFSTTGPIKCSGLEIKQYDEAMLIELFNTHFNKLDCICQTHETPFSTTQDFAFCAFIKK